MRCFIPSHVEYNVSKSERCESQKKGEKHNSHLFVKSCQNMRDLTPYFISEITTRNYGKKLEMLNMLTNPFLRVLYRKVEKDES